MATVATGATVVIATGRRFTFGDAREFRRSYEGKDRSSRFVVDLRETEYIDSSGLGMLLILREYATGGRVVLANVRASVRKILEVAHFERMFEIGGEA